MSVCTPHFLLFSQTSSAEQAGSPIGRWQFVLEAADGSSKLEASDDEPDLTGERLELLAVVRGLEALDQPSRVTLVTPSRYVTRGLNHGLAQWRENNWKWEHYGETTSVRHDDLWRRVDCALQFHRVRCRCWRFDSPHPARRDWDRVTWLQHGVSTLRGLLIGLRGLFARPRQSNRFCGVTSGQSSSKPAAGAVHRLPNRPHVQFSPMSRHK